MSRKNGRQRRKPEYWNERVEAKYSASLSGLSHAQLKRQRGLRGSTLGPASEGRRLSDSERSAIEQQLRASGIIT